MGQRTAPPKAHIPPEPQKRTLFGNRAFEGAVSYHEPVRGPRAMTGVLRRKSRGYRESGADGRRHASKPRSAGHQGSPRGWGDFASTPGHLGLQDQEEPRPPAVSRNAGPGLPPGGRWLEWGSTAPRVGTASAEGPHGAQRGRVLGARSRSTGQRPAEGEPPGLCTPPGGLGSLPGVPKRGRACRGHLLRLITRHIVTRGACPVAVGSWSQAGGRSV